MSVPPLFTAALLTSAEGKTTHVNLNDLTLFLTSIRYYLPLSERRAALGIFVINCFQFLEFFPMIN